MVDFSAVRSYLENNNLEYLTFYPKSLKPMEAMICQLPLSTLAEDISAVLVSLGFDVISIKQMTAAHQSPCKGSTTINLHLLHITSILMKTRPARDAQQMLCIQHSM
jgi:hypothetical protein